MTSNRKSSHNSRENELWDGILLIHANTSSRTIAVTFDAGVQTAGRSCPIRLLLCDRQGILYRQTSGSAISGELTELSLSYAGLSHGQYVLYIEACGKQYSEIFSVN